MPVISRFYGLSILMFYYDHRPPHFHVKYSGAIGIFEIKTGKIITGNLPTRAKKLVKEWLNLHQEELVENWERLEKGENLKEIKPLA